MSILHFGIWRPYASSPGQSFPAPLITLSLSILFGILNFLSCQARVMSDLVTRQSNWLNWGQTIAGHGSWRSWSISPINGPILQPAWSPLSRSSCRYGQRYQTRNEANDCCSQVYILDRLHTAEFTKTVGIMLWVPQISAAEFCPKPPNALHGVFCPLFYASHLTHLLCLQLFQIQVSRPLHFKNIDHSNIITTINIRCQGNYYRNIELLILTLQFIRDFNILELWGDTNEQAARIA